MTIIDLLFLLLVAAIAGAVSQGITGYSTGGCLTDIAVGFVGAIVGTWMARSLGLPELLMLNIGGTSFPVLWSIIGGALFLALVRFISRPRRAERA
jgi:uncharacterized membrane protein YeaQ/YmgE (transglycosylase-associated protein family)